MDGTQLTYVYYYHVFQPRRWYAYTYAKQCTYFVVLYVIQQPAQCMLCKGNTNDLLLFASIGDKITGTSTTQCVSQQQSQADSLV